MALPGIPIRRRLIGMILLASGTVLAVTTTAFCVYDLLTFRQSSVQQLQTLSTVIATNSTAALAFDNADDATAVLDAFKAEPHIAAAAIYDAKGHIFAQYQRSGSSAQVPSQPPLPGYAFDHSMLRGSVPIVLSAQILGTLYVESDLDALYARAGLYAAIMALVVAASLPLAYFISRRMQYSISGPILALADKARSVSEQHDYSVRALPTGTYEIDLFTDTFNQMLGQIEHSEGKLRAQLSRLSLLQQITRATGDRQDLKSISLVVLGRLEDSLVIELGCALLYDASSQTLVVSAVRGTDKELLQALGLTVDSVVPVDRNGLSRCIAGQVVYEPDLAAVAFPFPQRLSAAGLGSMVIAPLMVENDVFGVMVYARRERNAFGSAECEFLQQLSEHTALASHQAKLYGALQQAYDDLRQTQQTVFQQERLRALGQMASGIAHDINNAISPVSLYTESLLEREPNLSDKARGYLTTIQRAIEDVARTVARMREFYREREAQLTLEQFDVNRAVKQVVELTRPRWGDQQQQRGVMIDLQTDLSAAPSIIMGAQHEIRDAITNLIFNAVDAMPEGGALVVRTRTEQPAGGMRVLIEVSDTGVGMSEETRRRCLEPFFTTKGERGTGLGLAMVYGMVQRHSAEIDIESAPGRGTTVRLSFPAHVSAVVTGGEVPTLAPLQRRLRILVIDDDPLLIKSLQDALQEDGHLITTAHGGQAGIDAFTAAQQRAERFDIVFTDLGMPHVDGRKVASSIKQLSPATPIILLTGWGQRLIAANDIPAHVNKVLAKPPRLHELRAALAELVA